MGRGTWCQRGPDPATPTLRARCWECARSRGDGATVGEYSESVRPVSAQSTVRHHFAHDETGVFCFCLLRGPYYLMPIERSTRAGRGFAMVLALMPNDHLEHLPSMDHAPFPSQPRWSFRPESPTKRVGRCVCWDNEITDKSRCGGRRCGRRRRLPCSTVNFHSSRPPLHPFTSEVLRQSTCIAPHGVSVHEANKLCTKMRWLWSLGPPRLP